MNRKEKKTFVHPPFPFWKTSHFSRFHGLKHPHVMGSLWRGGEQRKGKGRYRADLSAQASTEAVEQTKTPSVRLIGGAVFSAWTMTVVAVRTGFRHRDSL